MAARAPRWIAGLACSIALLAAAMVVLAATGSGEQPPATGAASVVPGDALAYLHLSTDAARPATRRATALAARFPAYPLLAAAVIGRLTAILGGGAPVDFGRDIRPWLGKEAAFALLNTPAASAQSLIVLDVSRPGLAHRLLAKAAVAPIGPYRRVELYGSRAGTELAFVRHYLAVGQDAGVRAAIDAADGVSPSLAGNPAYQQAAAGEPADRVLDGYVSAAGVRRVLAPRGGVAGALAVVLSQPALRASTISVSAGVRGARIRVHSALDPSQAGTPPPSFAPTLAGVLPAGSALTLDLSALDRAAPTVLAASAQIGLGSAIGPLLRRLGAALAAEGVDVPGIVSIFHGESAVTIAGGATAPAVIVVARTRTEDATRSALAALEGPLAQLFAAPADGPGQAPLFNDRQVAGVTAHQLALAPGLQIDYAVFDGLVVVSTSLQGLADVASHAHSLAADPGYRTALAGRPDQVTSLLFLDFSQLLNLGDQTRLIRSSRSRQLWSDLNQIRTVGMSSTRGEADTTAELFLQIP